MNSTENLPDLLWVSNLKFPPGFLQINESQLELVVGGAGKDDIDLHVETWYA